MIARGLPGRALVRVVEEVPVSADDEVLALLIAARKVGEVEQPPDGDLADVADRLGALIKSRSTAD